MQELKSFAQIAIYVLFEVNLESKCTMRGIKSNLEEQLSNTGLKEYLALSGGESSLVLLDILGSLLQEQNELHKGKQGFELVVVNLDEFELDSLNNRIQKVFPELLAKYQPVK